MTEKRNYDNIPRQEILREILPASLVPSATGTAFLVIGSRPNQCFFPLALYLVVAGAISLSIPVLAAVFRIIYRKIYKDDRVDSLEAAFLTIMKHFSTAIVIIEVLILLLGVIVIFPNLSKWQYEDPSQTETFCELSLLIFTLTFMVGCWSFMILFSSIYIIIYATNKLISKKEKTKDNQ